MSKPKTVISSIILLVCLIADRKRYYYPL